ncbi:MAG: hypothetical protein II951_00160 [Bacteroidales bacterium]|nr:hypothetical protein [Bacteroidales bacterium]
MVHKSHSFIVALIMSALPLVSWAGVLTGVVGEGTSAAYSWTLEFDGEEPSYPAR